MADETPDDERATADTTRSGETYGGVFGAFPYAFRASDSGLFRSYVVLGGLLAALVTVVFAAALIQLVANTLGTAGGTTTFVRSFYIVLGALVVVPVLAPVLLVARRHRRQGSRPAYDRALAAAGYLFAASLYVALIVAAPPALRDAPTGVTAPIVSVLYALPAPAGIVPPVLAVGIGYLLHRRYR